MRRSLKNSKLTAFGSTRRGGVTPSRDANIRALLQAKTDVVTIFGKCWKLHVQKALRVSLQENLDMIYDSVRYLKKRRDEVFFDAEHFFDGFKDDPDYALKTLKRRAAPERTPSFSVIPTGELFPTR